MFMSEAGSCFRNYITYNSIILSYTILSYTILYYTIVCYTILSQSYNWAYRFFAAQANAHGEPHSEPHEATHVDSEWSEWASVEVSEFGPRSASTCFSSP